MIFETYLVLTFPISTLLHCDSELDSVMHPQVAVEWTPKTNSFSLPLVFPFPQIVHRSQESWADVYPALPKMPELQDSF